MPTFANGTPLVTVRGLLNDTGLRKNDYAAQEDPTPDYDERFGWEPGSRILAGGVEWVCKDATTGAAVWVPAPDESAVVIATEAKATADGAVLDAATADAKAVTADNKATAADAKATEAQAVAVPHADYVTALAAATSAPTTQNRISALIGGQLVEWVRQSGGPCLGGGWVPAKEAQPAHFNGNVAAAASYAFSKPSDGMYYTRLRTDVAQAGNGPWIGVYPSGVVPAKNHIFVRQDTSVRDDANTVQIQRIVSADHGLSNPKALRVVTNVNIDTAQTEWAISGELNNYSNAISTGNTATSGVANKYGLASVFAGHFQANDHNKYASPSDVTAIVGTEMNLRVVGQDSPIINNGFGARYVLDVLPRTNTGVAGWDDPTGNYGDGEVGVGIRVRCDNMTDAYFRTGIAVLDGVGNPNPMGTGIRVDTAGANGISITGGNTAAHIVSAGSPWTGAIFSGSYGSGNAIRLAAGMSIAMENTGAIKMNYDSDSLIWGFYNGAAQKAGFFTGAAPHLRIGGKKVVERRKTGWQPDTGTAKRSANATYSGTAPAAYDQAVAQALMDAVRDISQATKALKDDLFSHGLIGA